MQNSNPCPLIRILKSPLIRILKSGAKTMRMFHDATCPKESYTPATCGCGFVQEWLESNRVIERIKVNALVPAIYSISPDPDMKPLFDLTELLESLRERSKNLPPMKDE